MTRKISVAAATLAAFFVVTPMSFVSSQAAQAAGGECIGVSIGTSSAAFDFGVDKTVVPGDKGGSVLTVTNTAATGADLTAWLETDPFGDPVFADDLEFTLKGNTIKASAAAGGSTPIAAIPLASGASVDLPVSWEYPWPITRQPDKGSGVNYKVVLRTAGGEAADVNLGCKDVPSKPTNPHLPGGGDISTPKPIDPGETPTTPGTNPTTPTPNNPGTSAPTTPGKIPTTSRGGISLGARPTITDLKRDGKSSVGDSIVYTYVVTNNSDQTIKNISILSKMGSGSADTLVRGDTRLNVTCEKTSLAPGESMTCVSAGYVITENDVKSGKLRNVATIRATREDGSAIEPVTHVTEIPLSGSKVPAPTSPSTPGDAGGKAPSGVLGDPWKGLPDVIKTPINSGISALANPWAGVPTLLLGISSIFGSLWLILKKKRSNQEDDE